MNFRKGNCQCTLDRIIVTVCIVIFDYRCNCNYPVPYRSGDGVLFSIDFFVYIFVSLSTILRENGWTDLHEIFREGVE